MEYACLTDDAEGREIDGWLQRRHGTPNSQVHILQMLDA